MNNFRLIVAIVVLFTTNALRADKFEITLRGKPEIWVTKKKVLLGDLMDIESNDNISAQTLTELGRIKIMDSPKPGAKVKLNGNHLLDALRKSGVDLTKIRYIIPRETNLSRASREISEDEVLKVVDKHLKRVRPDAKISKITMPFKREIFTGKIKLVLKEPVDKGVGRLSYPLLVKSSDNEELVLPVEVSISEYKKAPVARRSIKSGEIITDQDLVMARINLTNSPDDLLLETSEIEGLKVTRAITSGQVFQKKFLKITPVVEVGQQLIVRYKKGNLEATATGIALDDGTTGEVVRVRQSQSNKILYARVIKEGLVEVGL